MPPKIGTLDIETAPNLIYAWGIHEQEAIRVKRNWYILGFAYKWLNEKKVQSHYICDYKDGLKQQDDKVLMQDLWNFLDEADIVIAHYGSGFDIPKIKARLMHHGFPPPSPFKVIDTKRALDGFGFDSKKLESMGYELKNIGHKSDAGGFATWEGCMEGDKKAFAHMRKYNIQDVVVDEKLYLVIRPWMTNHPNLSSYTLEDGCPKCGGKHNHRRGFSPTPNGQKQRLQCQDCGGWWSVGPTEKIKRNPNEVQVQSRRHSTAKRGASSSRGSNRV